MTSKFTPNLDAHQKLWEAAHASVVCPCERLPSDGDRTSWLRQHGSLRRKLASNGIWRRQWQCNRCLRHLPGDGRNAGPPTTELPEFLPHDHPERIAANERRNADLARAKASLPPKREAWFKDHNLYLQSVEWRELRRRALERDGHKCAKCRGPAEQVHHLTYDRWQNENLEDLVSLCGACHELEHAQ